MFFPLQQISSPLVLTGSLPGIHRTLESARLESCIAHTDTTGSPSRNPGTGNPDRIGSDPCRPIPADRQRHSVDPFATSSTPHIHPPITTHVSPQGSTPTGTFALHEWLALRRLNTLDTSGTFGHMAGRGRHGQQHRFAMENVRMDPRRRFPSVWPYTVRPAIAQPKLLLPLTHVLPESLTRNLLCWRND